MKKSAANRTELDRFSHGGHAMHTTGEVMAKIGRNSKELLAAGLVAAGAIGAAPVFGAEANVDDYSHSAQETVDTALGQSENVAPTDSEQPLPDPNRLAAQEVAGRISHLALRAMGGGTPSAEGQTPTPTGPTSPERGGGEAYTPPESIPNGAHDENSQFFDDLRFAIDQSEAEAAVMGVWDQFSSHGLLRVRVLTESTEGLPLQNEQDGQVLSYSDGKPVMLLDGQIVFAVRLDETTNVHTDNQIVAILEGRDGRLYKGVFQARGNEEFSELLVLVDPNEGHEGDEENLPELVVPEDGSSTDGSGERIIAPAAPELLSAPLAQAIALNAQIDQDRANGELLSWHSLQIGERTVLRFGRADQAEAFKQADMKWGITDYLVTPGTMGESLVQEYENYLNILLSSPSAAKAFVLGEGLSDVRFDKTTAPQLLIDVYDNVEKADWYRRNGVIDVGEIEASKAYNKTDNLERVLLYDRATNTFTVAIFITPKPDYGWATGGSTREVVLSAQFAYWNPMFSAQRYTEIKSSLGVVEGSVGFLLSDAEMNILLEEVGQDRVNEIFGVNSGNQ